MENNTVFLNKEDEHLLELIRTAIIDKTRSEYDHEPEHKNNTPLDNIIRTNIEIKIDDIISPELVGKTIEKLDNNTNFSYLSPYAESPYAERRYKKILFEQYGDISLMYDEKDNSIELIIYFKVDIKDHEFNDDVEN